MKECCRCMLVVNVIVRLEPPNDRDKRAMISRYRVIPTAMQLSHDDDDGGYCCMVLQPGRI